MGPASGDLQIFPFPFDRMINLIAVRDAYPAEIIQEFPRMAGVARLLVFIQDNLAFCVHPSGAVYPHVTFAPGRAAVLIHQHGRFVL